MSVSKLPNHNRFEKAFKAYDEGHIGLKTFVSRLIREFSKLPLPEIYVSIVAAQTGGYITESVGQSLCACFGCTATASGALVLQAVGMFGAICFLIWWFKYYHKENAVMDAEYEYKLKVAALEHEEEKRKTTKLEEEEIRRTILFEEQERRETTRLKEEEKRKTIRLEEEEKRKTILSEEEEKRKTMQSHQQSQQVEATILELQIRLKNLRSGSCPMPVNEQH